MDDAPDNVQMVYLSGASIARDRMAREAPLDAAALAAIVESDVVVVAGVTTMSNGSSRLSRCPTGPFNPGRSDRSNCGPNSSW